MRGQPVWSPDGSTLLFTGNEREDDELNQEQWGQIYAVSVNGGDVRALPTTLVRSPARHSHPTVVD